MHRNARRFFFGAALMAIGLLVMSQAEAANIADDEFKMLVEQDAKLVNDALAKGNPDKNGKAADGIKSSAMMIAFYAQNRIDGKDAAADQKMATLRDNAIKVVKAVVAKKSKDAEAAAKLLVPNPEADKAASTKKVDLTKVFDFRPEALMHQFKKPGSAAAPSYALGVEAEIKDNAKKLVLAPEKVSAIAARVIALAEYSKDVLPAGTTGAKKVSWDKYNDGMAKAAEELLKESKAGKANAKKIQDALKKVDGSCVACHNEFK